MIIKIGHKRKLCPFEIKTHNLRAKFLIDLYEGRKSTERQYNIGFCKFKGFFKNFLQAMGYSIKRYKL